MNKETQARKQRNMLRIKLTNIMHNCYTKVSAEREKRSQIECNNDNHFDALALTIFEEATLSREPFWQTIKELSIRQSALLFRNIFQYGRLVERLKIEGTLNEVFADVNMYVNMHPRTKENKKE